MSAHLSACPHPVPLAGAPAGSVGRAWTRIKTLLAAPAPVQWAVPVAGAVSLFPQQCSTLKVAAGQAWVTLRVESGSAVPAHDSASRDSGDYFLQVGDSLQVAAGQHVVLEAAGSARVQGVLSRA